MKRISAEPQRPGLKRGADIEADLRVTLERVAHGGQECLQLSRSATCPACCGSGGRGGAARRRCEACQGSGHVTQSQRDGGPPIQCISPCAACYGHGSRIDHPCTTCRGTGTIAREETLTVTIPRGVADDTVLRVAGLGIPSTAAAGRAGDLLVRVRTLSDARFERDGANLLSRETIALTDAVLGTTLSVPTLDKTACRLRIPPGTQAGTVLRLPGKGLPVFGGKQHGALQVSIGVHIPKTLSPEERALYQRLRALAKRAAPDR